MHFFVLFQFSRPQASSSIVVAVSVDKRVCAALYSKRGGFDVGSDRELYRGMSEKGRSDLLHIIGFISQPIQMPL